MQTFVFKLLWSLMIPCSCTSVILISCCVLMPLLGATMSVYITNFLIAPPLIRT